MAVFQLTENCRTTDSNPLQTIAAYLHGSVLTGNVLEIVLTLSKGCSEHK